jgi:hypothetical protein
MIAPHEARVNVTWAGQNGDLPDPVARNANEREILGYVTEAVRTGGIPGIARDPKADFREHVVDRFGPTDGRPYDLIQIRPKTPFG